jgi:predicted membrane channel-forming protein YqfA (hemolysin III family)
VRLTWKDAAATTFTALAVLTFAATHQGWNVWLVGSSHRWAAGVILVLGAAACAQGSRAERGQTWFFAALGALALALAIAALWTASLTPLSLLVASIVVLWAAATLRHVAHRPPARLVT